MTGTMSADAPTALGKEHPRARPPGPASRDQCRAALGTAPSDRGPWLTWSPCLDTTVPPGTWSSDTRSSKSEASYKQRRGQHKEAAPAPTRSTDGPRPAQPPTANGCPRRGTPSQALPPGAPLAPAGSEKVPLGLQQGEGRNHPEPTQRSLLHRPALG